MRVVNNPEELAGKLEEASASRGGVRADEVSFERSSPAPALEVKSSSRAREPREPWERDCSVRGGTRIVEAPQAATSPAAAAKHLRVGVSCARRRTTQRGNVESRRRRHKEFYFIEVNPRIQVSKTLRKS